MKLKVIGGSGTWLEQQLVLTSDTDRVLIAGSGNTSALHDAVCAMGTQQLLAVVATSGGLRQHGVFIGLAGATFF